MTPPEVYIAIFRLVNGKTMPMLSSPRTYQVWFSNPVAYANKRVARFNNKKAGRLAQAIDFTMEKYVRVRT